MNYHLIKDIIDLTHDFERSNKITGIYSNDVTGFKQWMFDNTEYKKKEPNWDGKDAGRSPESVINTLFVHMNRYAKNYSKSAIYGSDFSTQEEFIYLINLKSFGSMTKMDLIRKNVHDKPIGMQIISRLISQGWVEQKESQTDKRSKVISITSKGLDILEKQMIKIRQATNIVTGDLTHNEKMELIFLLDKLDDFHRPIYSKNLETDKLLECVLSDMNHR